MGFKGWGGGGIDGKHYIYAHTYVANPAEEQARKNPDKIENMIQSFLDQYRPKSEVVEPEPTKPEKQTNWWESEVYQEPKPKQVSIPIESYRGYSRLIQPDLGVSL